MTQSNAKEIAVLNVLKNATSRTLVIAVAVALAVGVLTSARAFAHHGANLYDMTKAVELKGTIAKFYFGAIRTTKWLSM
jgi:hypothetical protein